MNYESFRAAWEHSLRESQLSMIGLEANETLDVRSLDRTYEVFVESIGGQDAAPFLVTATLRWRWTALQTARAHTKDEDVLSEMLGRDQTEDLETEKPWVRVEIKLSARAPYDAPLPMPSSKAWAEWSRETLGRLERIEPLIFSEDVRVNRMGMLEVLAWRQQPKVTAVCSPTGELLLEAIQLSAGQLIELPRVLDCPDEPDEGPEEQLDELFQRVRASLMAWMQALDHLTAKR